ncbi:MAG: hypothetical protein JNM90_00970 [Burkholderiales bacterium]|nr:hypothetical protein [Burkholderiales bacterium]
MLSPAFAARRRLAVVMAAALGAALAGAAPPLCAQALEIIELRHRPAEQMLPLLQPLLAAGGTASGTGFQLFVRTTPANLAQIRQVVASLDRAPRQLLIHVRQDAGATAASAGVGGTVVLAPGASGARAGVWDRTATAQDNVSQVIRVLEGNPAVINTGASTLVPQRTVTRTAGGAVVVQESAVQRDYATGFVVTPRLSGDTVHLEIGAQRDTPLPDSAGLGRGAAAVNRVVSTVSARLGEWVELAVVNQAGQSEGRGLLARSSDAATQERRVFVRVEEVR